MKYDIRAGEFQQTETRAGQLLEAHQNLAKTVEPRMSHLDYPPSWSILGMLMPLTLLFRA
jgi:hypothetical protein